MASAESSHNKISTDDLISELRRLNSSVDGKPTTKDMRSEGKYSSTPYSSRFGSWTAALEAAGIDPSKQQKNRSERQRELSEDSIKEEIYATYEEHGKVTKDIIDNESQISSTAIQIYFDDFNSALVASGVPVTHEIGVSESVECHNCGIEFSKEPNQIEGRKRHFCSNDCRMGWMHQPNLEVSCNNCGKDFMTAPVANNEVSYCSKKCYNEYWVRNTSNPKSVECKNCGTEFSRNRVSAEKGPNYCRLECFHEDHSNEEQREKYYGPNWKEQRQKALKRDGERCQDCGIKSEEHKIQFGRGLHVHHIIPARKFEDYRRQNELDNLVSLCIDCHNKWEGLFLAPDRREN